MKVICFCIELCIYEDKKVDDMIDCENKYS